MLRINKEHTDFIMGLDKEHFQDNHGVFSVLDYIDDVEAILLGRRPTREEMKKLLINLRWLRQVG